MQMVRIWGGVGSVEKLQLSIEVILGKTCEIYTVMHGFTMTCLFTHGFLLSCKVY